MSNDNSFSYSYTTGNTSYSFGTNTPPAAPTLYALDDLETLSLPDNQVMLMSRHNTARVVVTADVSVALSYCREFRTLRAHAEQIAASIPQLGGNVADIEQVLTGVKDAGLMLSADSVCQRLNQGVDASQQPAPSMAFIITCDRPQTLERLLDSLRPVDLSTHHQVTVVDNSRQHAHQQRNRALVEEFNVATSTPLHYFGETEQNDWLAEHQRRLPEHSAALEFLFSPARWRDFKSYGLSRNFCLALSVGYRCLMMDEDAVAETWRLPLQDGDSRFQDGLRESVFFKGPDAWRDEATPLSQDPFAAHLQCLGLSVGQAIEALDNSPVTPEQISQLEGEQSRSISAADPVLITECGTLGNAGSSDVIWMYLLEGDSFQRLIDFHGGDLPGSPWNWVGQSRPTFTSTGNMSLVTGLDNSALLPPYLPIFRSEDLLFGLMTHYLHPTSRVLQYNWAVPHLPLEPRSHSTNYNAPGSGMSVMRRHLAANLPAQSGDLPARLEQLALVAEGIASGTDEALTALYRTYVSQYQSSVISILTEQVQLVGEANPTLTRALNDARQGYFKALQQVDGPEGAQGVPNGADRREVLDELRNLTRDFAQALRAWPTIRDALADDSA